MMLAVLSLLGMNHIHQMNAVKNVLGALVNGVVAVVAFMLAGVVVWAAGIVMIAGGITVATQAQQLRAVSHQNPFAYWSSSLHGP